MIRSLKNRLAQKLSQALRALRQRSVSRRMRKFIRPQEEPYGAYLETQLQRTLLKDDGQLSLRSRNLIDLLASYITPEGRSVLSVGCRNRAEIDYFRARGFPRVTGIDLYSESPDIRVMDMHDIRFPDGSFDVVYSSHSLEHSLRPEKAAAEFARVGKSGGLVVIEVPANYPTTEADLVDFGSTENLLRLFSDRIGEVVYEKYIPQAETAGEGTDVLRVLFRLK